MSTSSDKKITNDATASFAGSLYQIVVALEKAFELNTGQKIWIEKFGDVTVSTGEQIEVKHYHAPLTAAHENLWKTIRNWMQSSFDSDKYTSLTLWTTQAISVESDLIK